MNITEYKTPESFLAALTKSHLASSEDNDFVLGLAHMLLTEQGHLQTEWFLATVEENGKVLLAAFLTPPWPVVLAAEGIESNQACALLVDHLRKKNVSVSGVNAPAALSALFASFWCDANKCKSTVKMNMRFYILTKVSPVKQCPGQMITADESHRALLLEWAAAFHNEVRIDENTDYVPSHVDAVIASGSAFMWVDRKPVCMAFLERPHPNGVSVGYVYTPPKYRKKGYATMLVAEVSRHALNKGKKYCALFTDASNPTTNSIYQKAGYRFRTEYTFFTFR